MHTSITRNASRLAALAALTASLLLVRRQALKAAEPFWSPPTRRVSQAVLPAFLDTHRPAAVPPEKRPEPRDQQLALAKDVPSLFQRVVHGEERLDQFRIGERVAREIGHLCDAETGGDAFQR